jgi:para-nitrobenzyl esterase
MTSPVSVVFFLLTLLLSPALADNLPRVSAGAEMLEGQWLGDTGIAVFRGVPFATPPLGDLRWKKPQAIASPQAQRRVLEFAPACMQTMRILDWYRDLAELFGAERAVYQDLEVSEDCLYLNVWSPALDDNAALPVMVWIHGGSNNSGWAYEPNYHGHALAAEGVVVVSIAYRVGVFGFFSPPGLQPEEGLANFGLWDQIAALQWIQANIRAFGGDPGNVTLFGESSGAEDISTLMFSDEATGLFQRAILQSTPAHDRKHMPTLATEQKRGREFAAALRLKPPDTLAALRQMPVAQLFEHYQAFFGSHRHFPVIDGQVVRQNEWSYIDAGRFPIRQMLIGNNANEAYAYIPEALGREDLAQRVSGTHYLDSPETLRLLAAENDPRRALDRVLTADAYLCHSQAFAAGMNASGGQAWMYQFSRVREGPGGAAWGAYHGTEYPYVFNTHDAWMPTTGVDRDLTEQVMAYWVQFARTGNPNGAAVLPWPRFRQPDYRVLDFNDRVSYIDAPEQGLCQLYQDARGRKRPGKFKAR